MKKIRTFALTFIVFATLPNMIGCRKFDKKKTTETLEKEKFETKKTNMKKGKELAELG